MLAAVVVLAGGALMTANAASNTVPPSNAGEHTEAAPAFNFENTPDRVDRNFGLEALNLRFELLC